MAVYSKQEAKKSYSEIGAGYKNRVFKSINFIRTLVFRNVRLVRRGLKGPSCLYALKRYGSPGYHVFFGYYDITPINFDDSILIAGRVPCGHKSSWAKVPLQIGYYRMHDNLEEFIPVSETMTWSWQLGCRLQWYPLGGAGKGNFVIYNLMVDGEYGCCIEDIRSKKAIQKFKVPFYAVSPDGCFAFYLNFSRLGRLRPGYGYLNLQDLTENERMPAEDGIWRLNMETGQAELLFSLADVAEIEPQETMEGAEHYFNHIWVSPDSTRFAFFHVWMKNGKRHTRLMTCNLDGSEKFPLADEEKVSHFTWKASNDILCFSTGDGGKMRYHIYRDRLASKAVVGENLIEEDGHPSYSPGHRFLLIDTYPDKYGDRNLLLYDTENQALETLGSFFSHPRFSGESRCDLHPRWSPSGRYIAFDSAHGGVRNIYVMDCPKAARLSSWGGGKNE